jgi:hypothetical protein
MIIKSGQGDETMTLRRVGWAALPLAAAIVGAFGGSASAAAAPTIQGVRCESVAAGRVQLFCNLDQSGAVNPVTIRWTVNGSPRPAFNDRADVSFSCRAGSRVPLSVALTDATGASAQFSDRVFCSGNPV